MAQFYFSERMCQRFLPQFADGPGRAQTRGLRSGQGPSCEYLPVAATDNTFLESLMETELYSIGAYFCDEHPELVDELVDRSEQIERRGLAAYAGSAEASLEETFETLLTGLAVRYYKAVAG